jgi:hypothetical protein
MNQDYVLPGALVPVYRHSGTPVPVQVPGTDFYKYLFECSNIIFKPTNSNVDSILRFKTSKERTCWHTGIRFGVEQNHNPNPNPNPNHPAHYFM